MRAALAACLCALVLTGCVGPFSDDAKVDFVRMDAFSVVLVGNGLLTAGPQVTATAEEPTTTTEGRALAEGLATPEQPAVAAGEEPGIPRAAQRAPVNAALTAAAGPIRQQTTLANKGLRQGAGKTAAPALQRLVRSERTLANRLAAIAKPPDAVQTLISHCRRAAIAARDLRAAVLAGKDADAREALELYVAEATAANGVIARLGLDAWPATRRLFP